MGYKLIPTSAEVIAVLRTKHGDDFSVFGTISQPDGDMFGNSNYCKMMTEYGFKDSDIPLMRIQTTWHKHPTVDRQRVNESTRYWLCFALPENDD